MGRVLDFNPDSAPIHLALRNGDAGHCHHALGRSEQAGQARDAVHAQIEQRAATGFVKPLVPSGAGPTITRPRQAGLADVASSDASTDDLERRAENGERGADQMALLLLCQGKELLGFAQICSQRLLHQNMLVRSKRGAGQFGVFRHRGKHDYEVHVA